MPVPGGAEEPVIRADAEPNLDVVVLIVAVLPRGVSVIGLTYGDAFHILADHAVLAEPNITQTLVKQWSGKL